MKNKTCKAVLLALSVVASSNASASGIPTVDVAAIAQAVTNYMNELEQYAEQLSQGVTQQEELMQAVEQYEQMLTEYEHMLTQMEKLEEVLTPREMEEIYGIYEKVVSSFPSELPDYTDPEWEAVNERVGNVFHRGNDLETMEDEIGDVPFSADAQAEVLARNRATYNQTQMVTAQHKFVDDMSASLEENMERQSLVAEKRRQLGNEDHLKTLQLLANQNELVLEVLSQQTAIDNADLKFSNQLDAHYFSQRRQAEQATLNKLNEKMAEPITVNNDPVIDF